jgi:hypothetical protein
MLLNKSSFSLEDVSQAPQQCEIEDRRPEFHNASPNSTRLRLPCSARIRDMNYINNLPNKRLCKIVFDEMHALSAHAWDYLPALQTVQCEIEGRRTEFHNASPNSTRLRLPCSARIRDLK